ncbi:MAG: endonuclease III domain-containing protein, partial [Candidatus Omnitrophota bacterium]
MTPISVYKRLKKRFGPQHWWPADTPFEVIVGAILTQNTAWTNVERALRNLKREGFLSFGKMHRMNRPLLAAHIRPAGFFRVKARRLKAFLSFLHKEYEGDLAKLFKEPSA